MARRTRQMIKIDEDKCNGCGLCVTACAEGALQIVDGKARLVSENYCDGLGACLGECPQGAISFETRQAEEFDEAATIEHLKRTGRSVEAHLAHMAEHAASGAHEHHEQSHGCRSGFVCPSARTIDRTREANAQHSAEGVRSASELRQWPVKLHLVNPRASFLNGAHLLIAADCTGFAYGSLHPDFVRGKVVLIGCPKFDDVQDYLDKLTEIFTCNEIRGVTVLKMEVPCCSGIARVTEAALEASGRDIPIEVVTIGLQGEVLELAASPA